MDYGGSFDISEKMKMQHGLGEAIENIPAIEGSEHLTPAYITCASSLGRGEHL